MFDNCCEAVPVEKKVPMGSMMIDSIKMLYDLLVLLNNIEKTVFGGNDNMVLPNKEAEPESLQNRAMLTCDLALKCIGKAKNIYEVLQ